MTYDDRLEELVKQDSVPMNDAAIGRFVSALVRNSDGSLYVTGYCGYVVRFENDGPKKFVILEDDSPTSPYGFFRLLVGRKRRVPLGDDYFFIKGCVV